eukprot:scaffold94126_cov18-Tisochrysis_lutea.AAC.2
MRTGQMLHLSRPCGGRMWLTLCTNCECPPPSVAVYWAYMVMKLIFPYDPIDSRGALDGTLPDVPQQRKDGLSQL